MYHPLQWPSLLGEGSRGSILWVQGVSASGSGVGGGLCHWVFGGCLPPPGHPWTHTLFTTHNLPVNRMNHRRLWKHYLSTTSLAYSIFGVCGFLPKSHYLSKEPWGGALSLILVMSRGLSARIMDRLLNGGVPSRTWRVHCVSMVTWPRFCSNWNFS